MSQAITTIFPSPVLQLLPLALDAASLRQQVIGANIANAGSVHADGSAWQPRKVSFEEGMRKLLEQSRITPPGLENARPRVVDDARAGSGIDVQVVGLSQTVLHHQALVKVISAELELLSLASNDGKK
ncbi:flagellar basal body rod protein FlgB [Lacisediminimonas profundi]|uniref:flagellar basal body rod protein FlgB n=1 Tax=Lacisediminimonas profundi TaxID=2603856 RepID=UPI00124B5F13|nr:flagellar basal body protein [Lacisediminimonas profundi]